MADLKFSWGSLLVFASLAGAAKYTCSHVYGVYSQTSYYNSLGAICLKCGFLGLTCRYADSGLEWSIFLNQTHGKIKI